MSNLTDFEEEFAALIAAAASKPPMMTLHINEPSSSVELFLDTKVNYYGEWIKGEGGDICLYRDMETNKVVGCHLPLYQKELHVSRTKSDGTYETLCEPEGDEMEFPITVKEIKVREQEIYESGLCKCGDMVAVRPCDEKFENKTFLGVYLGDFALTFGAAFNKDTGTLEISRSMYNPTIFIPEKNEIVFGCGSWWGRIKREDQLKQITDQDIENIWYVKALRQLQEKEATKNNAELHNDNE